MNRSTPASGVARAAALPDQRDGRPAPAPPLLTDEDQAARPDGTAPQLLPGTGPKQLDLPISFTATRGCDRIRARLWADHRLKGLVLDVCLALSEFADIRRKAWPKQTTLAKMVHASRQRVSMALSSAAKHAVLVKDRHRRGAGCQYTFLESWIAWFRTPGEGSKKTSQTPFRCHERRHLDVTKGDISGEPVQGNLISNRYAVAGTPRAREADQRQQQQPGWTNRIEGLIGAIAARSRSLARPFDEAATRQDLATGERTVDDLQREADELERDCLARPFADPATGRHVQRNPEAIAASVEHQRRLAADEGRPFDEAAARLEAERADDRHLAQCLALGDRRQERAGEDGD